MQINPETVQQYNKYMWSLFLKQFLSPEEGHCPTKKIMYVPAVFFFHSSYTQLLFEPKIQEAATCYYQSIILADPTTKSNCNKNTSIRFSVPVTNNSDEPVICYS